ncbi:MAG TPA: DNA-formamidopyrimidine glycosylase family protein [Acidimicrobiales bacterium]|nr:DNA-formamidopyrimidine glycosylase family protein [Acidimicrobiales bacterium]
MPELPEVEALARFLGERTVGHRLARVELGALAALKTFAPPLDALAGRTVGGVTRRGKHLCVATDGPWLVAHLARGGWVQWRDRLPEGRTKPGRGPLALRVGLDDGAGFDLTEQGTEKRLALWVVGDPADVEHVATLGPDPLAADFDADALGAALAGGGQLKGALTDQRRIAGVGNAYSDEALHRARLSPFRAADKLTAEEVGRLHDALVGVLSDALERSLGLPAKGLKGEKRSGMAVHGRTGEACPVCGDVVREVAFATKSLQYCATCQTGGKPLADRRLSRLLK